MGGFLHLVKGEDAGELDADDRERLEVMAGVSAFPDARQMRDAGLAHDEIGAGGRRQPRKPNERRTAEHRTRQTLPRIPPEELEAFTQKLVTALKTVLRSGDPGRHLRTRAYL